MGGGEGGTRGGEGREGREGGGREGERERATHDSKVDSSCLYPNGCIMCTHPCNVCIHCTLRSSFTIFIPFLMLVCSTHACTVHSFSFRFMHVCMCVYVPLHCLCLLLC